MAKDKESAVSRFVKKDLSPIITGFLKKVLDSEVNAVQNKFKRSVNSRIRSLYLSAVMFTGAVFIMIGFAILIERIISFPNGSGFILVGLIILLLSFIIKNLSR